MTTPAEYDALSDRDRQLARAASGRHAWPHYSGDHIKPLKASRQANRRQQLLTQKTIAQTARKAKVHNRHR